MGLKQFVIANGLVNIFRHMNRHGNISELAGNIDKSLDASFPNRSEKIQEAFVQEIILPLGRHLMKENPEKYVQILEEHQHQIFKQQKP